MATQQEAKYVAKDKALEGTITDADIERAKRQVGIPTAARNESWNPVPDYSGIAHYAQSYGDDNPLWTDRNYAGNSRWGDVIAPPMFVTTAGINVVKPFEKGSELHKLFRGLFVGVGKYYSGSAFEWYAPVRPNQLLLTEGRTTVDVQVKASNFSGGARSVLERYRQVFADIDGNPIANQGDYFFNAERGASKKAGKNDHIKRHVYDAADIAEIEAGYASEVQRGAEPRYFEDVNVGDALGHLTKGPLTVLDIIGWHNGHGFGRYGIGPLRFAYRKRQKMPAFFITDDYGVPDVAQRMHWDPQWAEQIGLPAPYDYGEMRTTWLAHLMTNWMGDNAFLVSLSSRIQGFNFIGDTHWFRGTVVGKRQVDGSNLVDVELTGTNQRDTVTTTGRATVVLPSTSDDSLVIPGPSEEIIERGRQIKEDGADIIADWNRWNS